MTITAVCRLRSAGLLEIAQGCDEERYLRFIENLL